MKDNQLQMDHSKHSFFTKETVANKEEEIKRVLDEIMNRMFEKSPVVPIEKRRRVH